MASCGVDGNIILRDVQTLQAVGNPLSGHIKLVEGVAFSPDSKTLASGSMNGTVILWDIDAKKPHGNPLAGHKKAVESIDFSPDGITLASGNEDSMVILWDVKSQTMISKPLAIRKEDCHVIYSVHFCGEQSRALLSTAYSEGVINSPKNLL